MSATTVFVFLVILLLCIGLVFLFFKNSSVPRNGYEKLQQENASLRAENITLGEKIDDLKEENTQKQNQLLALQKENTTKEQQISKYTAQNELLHEQLVEVRNTCNNLDEKKQNLEQQQLKAIGEKSHWQANYQALEAQLKIQKEEMLRLQKTSELKFQQIANEILEEKSNKFSQDNKNNLSQILEPLGKDILSFKEKVEKIYEQETRERFSLNSTIRMMMEQTDKISKDANNLASALKGQSKLQGDWGEMILERILEQSGLQNGIQYQKQYSMQNAQGKNLRPDFLIKLPKQKVVIVDSKVSLSAYEQYCNSNEEIQKRNFLKLHLLAIRNHIESLHQKKYDDLEDSLDFTMMFLPIEPAFLLAVQNDPELWNAAYKKNIILVSPTNLIAMLKIINDLWTRENQNKNTQEITKRAELLYEKLIGFLTNIQEVGDQMQKATLSYQKAIAQLNSGHGNIISQTIKLKNLGLKSTKEVPEKLHGEETLRIQKNDNRESTERKD